MTDQTLWNRLLTSQERNVKWREDIVLVCVCVRACVLCTSAYTSATVKLPAHSLTTSTSSLSGPLAIYLAA